MTVLNIGQRGMKKEQRESERERERERPPLRATRGAKTWTWSVRYISQYNHNACLLPAGTVLKYPVLFSMKTISTNTQLSGECGYILNYSILIVTHTPFLHPLSFLHFSQEPFGFLKSLLRKFQAVRINTNIIIHILTAFKNPFSLVCQKNNLGSLTNFFLECSFQVLSERWKLSICVT